MVVPILGSERLAAIRNLPDLELEPEQQEVAIGSGLTAEELVFKDESYLLFLSSICECLWLIWNL